MMMRSISKSIALTSVILTSAFAEIPANALDISSLLKLFPQASVSGGNSNPTPSYNTPTSTSSTQTNTASAIEQAIHNQVNQYRASRGLPALALDARISEQARIHSQNMANGSVPFSHDGFQGRVQIISRAIPYSSAAENVAYNYGHSDPAAKAVQGWINSSGHRQNMEGNFNLTGIGVARNAQGRYYFTQIFIRGQGNSAQPTPAPTPAPAPVTQPPASTTPAASSVSAIEQAIHNQVNQYRASRGLPPLTLDSRVSQQSRIHSQNMANGSVPFSHNGFDQRVQVIRSQMPYGGAAENVAYNYGNSDPATTAVRGWINSSGHRQNMEGNFNLTGIGVARNAQGRYYFTQIFVRSR